MTPSSTPAISRSNFHVPHLSLWLMVGILLIAAAFRFLAVDIAPPGWRDDELIEFDMDRRIADGWRPLFITEAEGHEPFYHYLHAGTLLLFGDNIIGYKWLPFAFGLLTVALTYALARRMFGERVALLAGALLAVSFWPIMYARFGVRHIGTLPLMLGAFYLLYPARTPENAGSAGQNQKYHSILRVLCGGVLLAAALMTYFAGRALPIILATFLVYLLIFHRALFKRLWWRYLLAIGIAMLIATPMFIEIARTPGAEKRTEVVGGPLIELRKGNVQPALETTLGTLGMFTFSGDPESLYNVPGRPVFDWITGIFFYIGVFLCVIRFKRVECGFALVWLLIGIAPAFVSLPAGSLSHTIAAQPVVYMLAAYGVIEVVALTAKWLERRRAAETNRLSRSLVLLFSLSFALVGIGAWLTTHDYFGTWANDWQVRFQYHAPTRGVARWLDQHPEIKDAAIGTHPNELALDPLALKLDTQRTVPVSWFNAETALVKPASGPTIFTAMLAPGAEVQKILANHAQLQQKSTEFDVYALAFGPEIPPPGAAFDQGRLILQSVDAPAGSVKRGETLTWRTYWLINPPLAWPHLKMFLHVLNDKGEVIAGNDREDFNFATSNADDFLQISQLVLPNNLLAGSYPVEVGWYDPETGERLKRASGSDRYPLSPLEVTAP